MELLKELEALRFIEMGTSLAGALEDAGGSDKAHIAFLDKSVSALFEACARNGISVVFTRNRKSIDEES